MSDDQAAGRRRRRSSSSPLDDDDLLREILLRVPPNPSTLPRASLVCKRWRRLVSDPRFLRRFRDHHRRPPLLGFFEQHLIPIPFDPEQGPSGNHDLVFHPWTNPAPPSLLRFSLGRALANANGGIHLLACRHGRVASSIR